MKNLITIGGKIGYLRERTGRYEWAEVIGINPESRTLKMKVEKKQSKYYKFINEYDESMERVIEFLKINSKDFPNKFLIKYKGTNKLY
jgi:hypothetical protein